MYIVYNILLTRISNVTYNPQLVYFIVSHMIIDYNNYVNNKNKLL